MLAAVTLVLSSPPPARFFPENAIAPLEEDDSAARLPIKETGYNQRFRRATVDSRHHATGTSYFLFLLFIITDCVYLLIYVLIIMN